MVRNIVVFSGSSHPALTENICDHLGIPRAKCTLGKFAVGETRVEIEESVRGKDVYIVQSGGAQVNDHFFELLITISACKTASAKRVTAVLPLFPYSRQSEIPYNKIGAPLAKTPLDLQLTTSPIGKPEDQFETAQESFGRFSEVTSPQLDGTASLTNGTSTKSVAHSQTGKMLLDGQGFSGASHIAKTPQFEPQRGYKSWVAQAGTLVADLLTCAGTDHVITMDLHDPQYQGFFDIPVDNLYGRHLLRRYIQQKIPDYLEAVIVSPDAGGAKRATGIADALGMPFALIHKERRPMKSQDQQKAAMILVGNVAQRTAIIVDDMCDTANTITRAAKLLKIQGAKNIIALVTHGVLSGDAIDRINASELDKLVVTNSVDQTANLARCPKLEILEVGTIFAEAIRRVHHGESISVLFQYD